MNDLMKPAKPLMGLLVVALCGLLPATAARAADISGQWRAEFDSPIGNGHDPTRSRNNLWLFSQRISK
jgi:hypothetical protein